MHSFFFNKNNVGVSAKVEFNLHSESFGSIVYYTEVLACLTRQITNLLEDLKRKEELGRNSDEEILGKLNSVNSENEKICLENEKLKVRSL